jgi:hypothetical protein
VKRAEAEAPRAGCGAGQTLLEQWKRAQAASRPANAPTSDLFTVR